MPRRSIPLFLILGALATLPAAASAQPGIASPIFINEIHYDNTGTDAGEAIEVAAPEGTNLAGYSIVLYNGSGGAVYDTDALSGTVGPSKAVTLNYPANGIQNGAPDGIALVGPEGVIQFLSYEGTFAAVGGSANGITSTSIGVSEDGSEPLGQSLQLSGSGDSYGAFTWQPVRASSFGALNAGQTYPATGGIDPPPPPPVCADTIAEVQGPGAATPCAGQVVTVGGIVTGDFQGATSLNGYFIQDPVADGDPNTSEGVFVFNPGGPALEAGDRVRVTGTAAESFGLTQIGSVTATEVLASGALPAATTFDLPADTAARERLEGMRVIAPEALTVTESRNADNFGELRLSSDEVLSTPTEVAEPGPAADAVAAENARRNVILDDAKSPSNPRPVPYLTKFDSLRRGDTTTGLTGILSFGFNAYRVQPTTDPTFVEKNPRPVAPDAVGGDAQVGSFNVLNYFITFNDRGQDRGAANAAEFEQQEAKIVDAINGLGAEVVALQEIQDTSDETARLGSDDPDKALDALVAALNADPDSSLIWAKVPAPSPYTNTDEIRNAIIYQPSKVGRVGAPGALNDSAFVNARTPLSQTFRAGAETFTVIGNHFKSKGGRGAGDNANTGQGSFNGDRTRQAQALLGYIEGLKTSTGDPDVLGLGDLNSYTREDPIDVLVEDGGLIDVATTRVAEADRYSFVFDGAQGNLDHEIATPELDAKITGADIWHINADEPDAFQYTGPEEFFAPDAFAASDHDPSLVGLETGIEPAEIAGTGVTSNGTRFDFTITEGKKGPADRAAFMTGASTQAGEITCVRRAGDRAVFGIADTLSGAETVYREFYVEDDGSGERLIELGTTDEAPKPNCSGSLARRGSGHVITSGSITFAEAG
ncbi:MAG: ExeM/NucH family extracellular endonuclease [Solirubrobacteraceae bacterium]